MPIRQIRKVSSSSFQTRSLSGSSSVDHRTGGNSRLPRHRSPDRMGRGLFWTVIRRILPFVLILLLVGGIFLVGAFAYYSKDLPDPNKIIERDVAQSTKIFDRTGERLLYEIHGAERRTIIELADIPQYAIDATISVEDKNFFKHGGISIWGILRGQIVPRLQGKRAQGGSTLTQQFVKNAILSNERSLGRKIKEWILSYQLEKKFSKEEILKLYFNEIPYGSTAYGIESASGIYFGKSAKDLSLAEAAILAALPQAPSYYSPYGSNKDALIDRQHIVLDLMAEQDYITQEEADRAKQEELVFKKKREDITAPHFVFMVQQELAERYGDRLVEQGGLTIQTTLDWDKQKLAEDTINELMPNLEERYQATNAALVTIDVESGDVLTMVGSRDFFNDDIDGQVNVATSLRQPGSSLKPFVYAKAFELGYNPNTILYDVNTNFDTSANPYAPRNYNLSEHGPISMRQALAGSLNIPAVKTLYLAGVKNVVELLQKFGYTTLNDPDRYGLSLTLGGGEVRLLEHTNAFAALARDGVYENYTTILKVTDPDGRVLEEKAKPSQRRILDKQVVRLVNGILSDNSARAFVFGENNYLTLGGRPVGAKTGTTNDFHDAWTMGFTPQLATGVWTGNSDNTAMNAGADGSAVAAPIWNAYMRKILAAYPVVGFPSAEPVDCSTEKPMVCGKLDEEVVIKINKVTGERATEFTPPEDIEEKKYREIHTILHYVNRTDPTGNPLSDPTSDPQYTLWEDGVKKWAEEQGYLDELPPELDDQLHSPENQPEISWISPSSGQTITTENFEFRVTATAKRGISKVDYFLDNLYVGTATTAPYNLAVTVQPNWKNRTYTVRATAYDDVNNSTSANIQLTLDVPKTNLSVNATWLSPLNNENYTLVSFPPTLQVDISPIKDIKKVDFYTIYDNKVRWLGVVENPTTSTITQVYSPDSGLGVYKFYLIITDSFGRVSATDEIIVNIKS